VTSGYYLFNAAPYRLTLLIMIITLLAETNADRCAGGTVDY